MQPTLEVKLQLKVHHKVQRRENVIPLYLSIGTVCIERKNEKKVIRASIYYSAGTKIYVISIFSFQTKSH